MKRKTKPARNVMPSMPGLDTSRWGARLPFETLRPLLLDVDNASVRAAVAAYDVALAHEHDVSTAARPARAAEVEAAYKAEQLAAAVAGRDPTLSFSTVQQAEAAEADHAAALRAAAELIGRRNRELYNVLRAPGARGAVVHVHALERQRLMMNGADPSDPTTAVYALHHTMLWPAIAYGPRIINSRGNPVPWWPLVLGGWNELAHDPFGHDRYDWNEWAWQRLAERKRHGFTVDAEGVLQFREVWRFIPRPSVPARVGDAPRLVMFGHGPHGEEGATVDDLEQRPGFRMG